MAGYWRKVNFSIITGVVRYSDLAYLSLVDDNLAEQRIAHSYVKEYDAGLWRGEADMDVKWDTVSATLSKYPLEQGLILGERGQVMCDGSGDYHFEQIGTGDNSPANYGPMRGIRLIGDQVYAVGMNRQVYRRDKKGNWTNIDSDIKTPPDNDEVTGFEAIDGFNEKEIYAVGWDGEIWQYDGRKWSQKDSPTNFVLVDVCCGGDGNVYACGRVGTLLRGRGDRWEVINHDSITDDIWKLAWFNDRLYLSTMDAVYTLDGDNLLFVSMGKDQPETCFHLSTADGVLWSIGAKDIMAYDGNTWTRID